MRRIPLRLKLTLVFTGVMAVLLAAAGIALSVLVAENLDSTIDDGLAARAGDAAAVAVPRPGTPGTPTARLERSGEAYAQVLTRDGRIRATTQGARGGALLTPEQIARAASHPVIVERRLNGAKLRLYGRPARSFIVVVGEPLVQREKALDSLHALLAIGGPLALLLASLVGYLMAAAALRPVERMRRRAAAISAEATGERLPVPLANDEIGRLGRTLNEMLAARRSRSRASGCSFGRHPRAAHAAGDPAHRARARTARAAHPRGARGGGASAAEESERLSSLAEELLVIARSDQGRLPVRTEA